jgi:putative transposase
MDFVSDGLADGRRLRCLNIVDDFTRECLAIEVDSSLTGRRVVDVMKRLADLRGLSLSITTNSGPEFAGKILDEWAYTQVVHINFIEIFNRRLHIKPALNWVLDQKFQCCCSRLRLWAGF